MTADLEHDEVAELLGAYALDAVDPDERRQVEQHLAECPRCRAEVDDLRQTAAELALVDGLDTERPPEAVWDRIAAGIGAGEPRPGHDDAVVVELVTPSRRSTRPARGRRAWFGAAAAGAAAAAIAALAVWGVQSQGQVHQLQAALARRGSEAAVVAALASPGHRVVELRSAHGTAVAEVVVRHDGAGFLVHSSMSGLPATETYQLWAAINGRPISVGLLGPRPALGAAFSLGNSAAGARELMVTVEPSGGVPTPDRAPIATAPLSIT